MKKLRNHTDKTLAKWRWSEVRTENEIHFGFFGLGATIQKGGDIAFYVRMTINGVRKGETLEKFMLGKYGIEEAREAAKKKRQEWRDIAAGNALADPEKIPLLKTLLDSYETTRRKLGTLPKKWDKEERPLIDGVYAGLMERKTLSIETKELHQAQIDYLDLRERETGKRPVTSIRRAYNCLKPVIEDARDNRLVRPETVSGWKTGLKREKGRMRFISPREWQLAAPALDALPKDLGLYPRFLIATAARRHMPSEMRWRDLRTHNIGTEDAPNMLTVWGVPDPENMKGGFAATFPIVGEAKRIIDLLRSRIDGPVRGGDYVFPEAPRTAWIDGGNPDYWQKRVFALSGTNGWHRHDLRRTAASLLRFVGANMEDVKLLLDHHERSDEDSDGSSTPRYVVIDDDNLEKLAALGKKMEEVHALLRQFEEGRNSKELRRLYGRLDASPKVIEGWYKAGVDRDTMVEIVLDPKHGDGKVTPLRPVTASA
jgi:hypothetical protein